jgi:uncharacterized protein YdhG (YjbR/CyaY superfamily)
MRKMIPKANVDAGFEVKASTVHFTPARPLPAALVKKIVKLRLQENLERQQARLKK